MAQLKHLTLKNIKVPYCTRETALPLTFARRHTAETKDEWLRTDSLKEAHTTDGRVPGFGHSVGLAVPCQSVGRISIRLGLRRGIGLMGVNLSGGAALQALTVQQSGDTQEWHLAWLKELCVHC